MSGSLLFQFSKLFLFSIHCFLSFPNSSRIVGCPEESETWPWLSPPDIHQAEFEFALDSNHGPLNSTINMWVEPAKSTDVLRITVLTAITDFKSTARSDILASFVEFSPRDQGTAMKRSKRYISVELDRLDKYWMSIECQLNVWFWKMESHTSKISFGGCGCWEFHGGGQCTFRTASIWRGNAHVKWHVSCQRKNLDSQRLDMEFVFPPSKRATICSRWQGRTARCGNFGVAMAWHLWGKPKHEYG